MDFILTDISSEELIKQIAFIGFSSFLVLFIMGVTNRVVVFSDGQDLFNSISIIISPLVAILLLVFFAPENPPQDYDYIWGSVSSTIVSIVLSGWFLYSVLMTYIQSIKDNGVLMGLVVGTFKVTSAIIITCFAIGWLNRFFDGNHKSLLTYIMMTIVLGVFVWVIKKLVNGEGVASRRSELSNM